MRAFEQTLQFRRNIRCALPWTGYRGNKGRLKVVNAVGGLLQRYSKGVKRPILIKSCQLSDGTTGGFLEPYSIISRPTSR